MPPFCFWVNNYYVAIKRKYLAKTYAAKYLACNDVLWVAEELYSIMTRNIPIVGKDDITGENIYEISRQDKSSGEYVKIHLPESQIDAEFAGPFDSIVSEIQKIENVDD